uniref:Uncharacterized protein n=1 Tax=Cyclopterus lumpus TaxID=8103 RepID=A0A8C3AWC1_CYCLU
RRQRSEYHRKITPSPTFDRAENLARLKDTTAKLSRGITPPPLLPQQLSERKSEIVESPASFHRQIKIESQLLGASETMSTGKTKKRISREAHWAEVNSAHVEEDQTYVRKEPILPRADLYEKANILEQEMPAFDIQAIKNVFELGEKSSSFSEEKTDQEETVSSLSETIADTSKRESPPETENGSRQSTPLPPQKTEVEIGPAEPSAFSEAKSITEHFSDVDEFGHKVTGIRTSVSEHSESVSTQRAPFSYADAVRKKAASAKQMETYDDDATDKLLSNFQKTWTESESVFKSLGYTISEETTSQVMSHQTKIVSSGKYLHGMKQH